MNFDWYPWYAEHYRRDTRHLSLAECGAYRRLIDEYMETGEALPDNDAALARLLGVARDEWLCVSPAVRPFFHSEQGKLTHKRCEEELHARAMRTHATSMKNTAAANTRWAKHRERKDIHTRAMRLQSARNAQAMLGDATLTKKDRLPSTAEAHAPFVDKVDNSTAAVVATKRPSEVTRQELDAQLAARRLQPDGLDIPPELRRI